MPKRSGHLSSEARLAFGDRVRQLAQLIGTRAEAAEVAGVTVQHLGRVIAGDVEGVAAATLARLAARTGTSLDWLIVGDGPRGRADVACATPQQIDPRLCGRIVEAIARAYKKRGIDLPNHELGRMAAEEHTKVAPLAVTDDQQIAVAKMIRQKYERILTERAEAVPSKRRA